ncbi:glycerophosphodiester phosphodiesterase [Streptomyces meridianus]|uniref:Glycerophosphodiester phosphodiesterase n=1 Tax=Streptomyces meridianus TaxID=2938945 RepID=A0ABT0X774_9ACTN|nr:glycerophosphodiester phosphodiesterase [Streptomyces meridianus]MCM2578378.1 glycerophosphodiester phosphodiesterase [Streptomyces meridianus]
MHAAPAVVPVGRITRVVAHRGASHDRPEHTLAAYRQAIEDGADALECDVRLTADGRLVCVHDRRVDRTSDGRGAVSAMTLDELDRLDFGSWKGGGAGPSRVLAFDELLALVSSAPRPVSLAVETKHPTRWAGRVERELVRQLRLFGLDRPTPGMPDRVRLMSFSRTALHRLAVLAPELPRVLLTERTVPGWGSRLPSGVLIAGPGIDLVRARPGLVLRLRAAGYRVHVWTVDEPDDVELCLRLGVEAVITNRPRQVLEQIGDR